MPGEIHYPLGRLPVELEARQSACGHRTSQRKSDLDFPDLLVLCTVFGSALALVDALLGKTLLCWLILTVSLRETVASIAIYALVLNFILARSIATAAVGVISRLYTMAAEKAIAMKRQAQVRQADKLQRLPSVQALPRHRSLKRSPGSKSFKSLPSGFSRKLMQPPQANLNLLPLPILAEGRESEGICSTSSPNTGHQELIRSWNSSRATNIPLPLAAEQPVAEGQLFGNAVQPEGTSVIAAEQRQDSWGSFADGGEPNNDSTVLQVSQQPLLCKTLSASDLPAAVVTDEPESLLEDCTGKQQLQRGFQLEEQQRGSSKQSDECTANAETPSDCHLMVGPATPELSDTMPIAPDSSPPRTLTAWPRPQAQDLESRRAPEESREAADTAHALQAQRVGSLHLPDDLRPPVLDPFLDQQFAQQMKGDIGSASVENCRRPATLHEDDAQGTAFSTLSRTLESLTTICPGDTEDTKATALPAPRPEHLELPTRKKEDSLKNGILAHSVLSALSQPSNQAIMGEKAAPKSCRILKGGRVSEVVRLLESKSKGDPGLKGAILQRSFPDSLISAIHSQSRQSVRTLTEMFDNRQATKED